MIVVVVVFYITPYSWVALGCFSLKTDLKHVLAHNHIAQTHFVQKYIGL